ncbi:MAG: hypothetical protein NTW28_20870 [Candidatus Solibacter sp.]|nr:hypothetical protein [Candidatus Solibacter sp.]
MDPIMGLIVVVSFRFVVKGTGTTAPTQEPAVADAKGFLRAAGMGGCGVRG